MKLNVMVTGGTGFIGHNVVLDLLEWTDWTFTIVDAHTYAGAPEKLTEDPRYDASRVRVVTFDLAAGDAVGLANATTWEPAGTGKRQRDTTTIPASVSPKNAPDVIFNIASNSHVDNSIIEPVPFIKDNVALVTTMLEYARMVKPKLFIQFSTDEVYGAAPPGVDFEEWSTILPSNPYSASKAAQEAIAISYWRTYGVPLVITNTMNVLGKHQHPEKFVPKTVEHLLAGKPMTVHAQWVAPDHNRNYCVLCLTEEFADRGLPFHEATGHVNGHWEAGSRFYTYVSNISSALKFLTERMELLGVVQYPDSDRPERFNLVGDREVKNDEMVDLIAAILGIDKAEPVVEYKEFIDFHSVRPGHDRRYALSGEALKKAGWQAPILFEDGLRITVDSALDDSEAREEASGM